MNTGGSVPIEGCHFGSLRVGGETYTEDLIILPDRIISDWWRGEGHRLRPEDLDVVFETKPDVLVVGSGYFGQLSVSDRAREQLAASGIELVVERTGLAWKTYNALLPTCPVGAALHLTC
jgi:hypothetical protein